MNKHNERCQSCQGTGETATDFGVVDCPDCGGSGELPTQSVRVGWRIADIERSLQRGRPLEPEHARWLVDELRKARASLTEIIALSHDSRDEENIDVKIRFSANRALGLYEVARVRFTQES